MLEEGLWKAKKARKVEVHQMRERRACHGELEQMDGTDHDWFEGRSERCTLLVMIDDATRGVGSIEVCGRREFLRILWAAPAVPDGPRPACRAVHRQTWHLSGQYPQYELWRQPDPVWAGHAKLEIPILCANTPQAKGRVERVKQTLQDRLVKEMRLRRSTPCSRAMPICPSSWQISTPALPSSHAVPWMPIVRCWPTRTLTRS